MVEKKARGSKEERQGARPKRPADASQAPMIAPYAVVDGRRLALRLKFDYSILRWSAEELLLYVVTSFKLYPNFSDTNWSLLRCSLLVGTRVQTCFIVDIIDDAPIAGQAVEPLASKVRKPPCVS